MAEDKPHLRPSGIPVDSSGGPTIDPTKNVLDLVSAATERLDDLREANDKLTMAELTCLRREMNLRAEHAKEIGALHREMRVLESDRVDKIRANDNLNASIATDRANEAIKTLAIQAQNTASGLATQLTNTFAEFNKRLSQVELSMSAGAGRQAIADPLTAQDREDLRTLRGQQAGSSGHSSGANWLWAVIVGVLVLIFGVIGAAAALYAMLK